MFSSKYMPCAECGASVERSLFDSHACVAERRLDYQMFCLRTEIADFEKQLRVYLETRHGRFESFVAARDVRRRT